MLRVWCELGEQSPERLGYARRLQGRAEASADGKAKEEKAVLEKIVNVAIFYSRLRISSKTRLSGSKEFATLRFFLLESVSALWTLP